MNFNKRLGELQKKAHESKKKFAKVIFKDGRTAFFPLQYIIGLFGSGRGYDIKEIEDNGEPVTRLLNGMIKNEF